MTCLISFVLEQLTQNQIMYIKPRDISWRYGKWNLKTVSRVFRYIRYFLPEMIHHFSSLFISWLFFLFRRQRGKKVCLEYQEEKAKQVQHDHWRDVVYPWGLSGSGQFAVGKLLAPVWLRCWWNVRHAGAVLLTAKAMVDFPRALGQWGLLPNVLGLFPPTKHD